MKIGWIRDGDHGRGDGGSPAVRGHELALFNRTRDKAKTLTDRGGRWCDSPAAVAAESEVVFTMVGLPADVEQTYWDRRGSSPSISPAASAWT